MAKEARSGALRRWPSQLVNGERASAGARRHRRRAVDGERDERRTGEVEQREGVEVRGEAEMVRQARREEPADQIARDIARDVGGEGAGGIGRAAVLAEIGQRQREGSGHEDALGNAQQS